MGRQGGSRKNKYGLGDLGSPNKGGGGKNGNSNKEIPISNKENRNNKKASNHNNVIEVFHPKDDEFRQQQQQRHFEKATWCVGLGLLLTFMTMAALMGSSLLSNGTLSTSSPYNNYRHNNGPYNNYRYNEFEGMQYPNIGSGVFAHAASGMMGTGSNSIYRPSLCSDGVTYGFSDWNQLRAAIHETNRYAEWLVHQQHQHYGGSSYHQNYDHTTDFDDYHEQQQQYIHDHPVEHHYWFMDDDGVAIPYQPPHPAPEPFVICPGVTLQQKRGYYNYYGSRTTTTSNNNNGNNGRYYHRRHHHHHHHNRGAFIFVDCEDLRIECDGCAVGDVGGTHFSFGPNAKGVSIKGVTFTDATTSSLIFYHHGADVVFEECAWVNNAGLGKTGAVADLNSTSSVSFLKCEISDSKQFNGGGSSSGGRGSSNGGHVHDNNNNAFASSSLTIRN